MANISQIIGISLFIIISTLSFSSCNKSPKMRTGKIGDRMIKSLHRRYSRKVQNAKTLEDFIRVFKPRQNVKVTLENIIATSMTDESIPSVQQRLVHQVSSPLQDMRYLPTIPVPSDTEWKAIMDDIYRQENATVCGEPRPVILDTHEELGLAKGFLQYVMPRCVQVNRCGQQSGCCKSETDACVMKEFQNVTHKVFIGTFLKTPNVPVSSALQYHTLVMVEHTLCECQSIHRTSCSHVRCTSPRTKNPVTCSCDCPRRCPRSYNPHPDTCECGCAEDESQLARVCRRIYRGRQVLVQDECGCVRSGQCSTPKCRSRFSFNDTTCMCARDDATAFTGTAKVLYGLMEAREVNVRQRIHAEQDEVPLVQSTHTSDDESVNGDDADKPIQEDDKLGGLLPDRNDYQYSSHTSQNMTYQSHVAVSNATTGPGKEKVDTVWEKASDDQNTTIIKDKQGTVLAPNCTAHDVISTGSKATDGTLSGNTIMRAPNQPTVEGVENYLLTSVPENDEIDESFKDESVISTDNVAFFVSSTFDSTDFSIDEDSYGFKPDAVGVPLTRRNNSDFFEMDFGSGDMDLGGH